MFRGHNFATDVAATTDDWELLAEWQLPEDVIPGQRVVGVAKADEGSRFNLGASVSVDGETWSEPDAVQSGVTATGNAFDIEAIWPFLRIYAARVPADPGTVADFVLRTGAAPSTGTFTISWGGDTTDPIVFDAAWGDILAAINSLPSVTDAGGVISGGGAANLADGEIFFSFVEPGHRDLPAATSIDLDVSISTDYQNDAVGTAPVPSVDASGIIKLRLF